MSKTFPATDRWLEDVRATQKYDRRQAYDARKRNEGLVRVHVRVPADHADKLKTFARFLRNCPDEVIEHYRQQFEDFQSDAWADYDAAVASGFFDPNADD